MGADTPEPGSRVVGASPSRAFGASPSRAFGASPSRAFGATLGRGRLRVQPEDFVVGEVLSFAPKGDGPHWLLRVRKRGANTHWVARQLAAFAGVAAREVGHAGLKDRHAVAEQWFSVPVRRDGGPDWAGFADAEFAVVEAHRHDRKLRTGAARRNSFDILVRDCEVDADGLAARVAAVCAHGTPNGFGQQRFGRAGDNAERGLALLQGRLRARDQHERGLWISALRSSLFNRVLAARLADGSWLQALPGECLMLEGTHSNFICDEPDAVIGERLARLDLHPTGPLPGSGEPRVRAAALACEQHALADQGPALVALADAGVAADRRALRCVVHGLTVTSEAAGLRFRFELPGGAYATSLLGQFVDTEEQEGEAC